MYSYNLPKSPESKAHQHQLQPRGTITDVNIGLSMSVQLLSPWSHKPCGPQHLPNNIIHSPYHPKDPPQQIPTSEPPILYMQPQFFISLSEKLINHHI